MKAFALALLSFLFLSLSNSCSDSSNKKSESQPTFSDVLACADGLQEAANEHDEFFKRKDQQLGLTALHGFSGKSWFDHVDINPRLQQVMIAGGLTAAYLDNDCWPDIVFASGDKNGMVAYINKGQQKGFADRSTILAGSKDAASYKLFSGVAIADVTGNYQRELVFGNVFEGHVPILSPNNDRSVYKEIDSLPVNRTTYGISFGDINGDGMPDMFLAHWDYDEVANAAPALWLNTDNGVFIPYDNQAGTNHPVMDQRYNFSAQFLDVRHSGLQDLLVASDFGTTSVLMNKGDGSYKNVTDINVITDKHGMGSAIGDIDNNGMMDWQGGTIIPLISQGGTFINNSTWTISGNNL